MTPSVSGARTEQAMPVDGAHRDDLLPLGAAHEHLDRPAGRAPPQRLVELYLRRDADAIHGHDVIAAPESRGPRRARLVEAVHDDAAVIVGRGVEAEPRAWASAHHAAGADELVLDGEEL